MPVVKSLATAFPARLISLRVSLRQSQPQLLAAGVVAAIALALAVLPPLVALWLVFGSALLVLVLVVPVAGFYLLPFAVGFGSLISLSIHGINVGPTDLFVGALALACGWRWKLALGAAGKAAAGDGGASGARDASTQTPRSRGVRRAGPQTIASLVDRVRSAWNPPWNLNWSPDRLQLALAGALVAYLGVVVLSLVVATDRVSTAKEILKWSEVTLLVACAVYLLNSLTRVHLLAWAAILAGTLESIFALAQWIATNGARVDGTFDQPNPLAGFLNFALPLAVALVLFSPDVRERWMAAAAAALLAGGEYAAHSRGATLGILAALVVIAAIGWHRERLVALVIGAGSALALLAAVARVLPPRLVQQLTSQVNLSDTALCTQVNDADYSTMERLAHWAAGLRMFAAHPVLGVGAGNYNAAYFSYNTWCWDLALGHAHNYYINAAAETGALGLAALLTLTAVSFALGWRATHPHSTALALSATTPTRLSDAVASPNVGAALAAPADAQRRALSFALALGFFGVVVALAVHNLTDDLFVHAMELQFAVCLGALLRLGVPSRSAA